MLKKILLAFLIILVAAVFIVLNTGNDDGGGISIPNVLNAPTSFPDSDLDPDTVAQGDGSKITIALSNDRQTAVDDFINIETTVADPMNDGNYVVAGGLGYCLPNTDCSTYEQYPHYRITYSQQHQHFFVTLLRTPLGDSRAKASNELQAKLGLDHNQMCMLNYSVYAPYFVSEEYAGVDFRFSFCSDVIELP